MAEDVAICEPSLISSGRFRIRKVISSFAALVDGDSLAWTFGLLIPGELLEEILRFD